MIERTETHLLDDFVNRPAERGDLQNRPTTRPLPDGWTWTNLESVTENHDGRRVPVRKSDRVDLQGQYPYYGASGIIDYVDDFIFQGDYLLLAEDGANLLSRSTPIAFQAHGKFWVNNHAHVIKTRHGMPLSYLEHYLNSIDLANYITGTAQPKLTQRNMNKIPVPLAPLSEQERIVAEIEKQFTRLDQAVVSLRRLQTNLSRYKASVLKAACEGRLVPQDPSDEPAEALLQRILSERRAQWQTTHPGKKYPEPVGFEEIDTRPDLPEIPKNWVWVTLGQLAWSVKDGPHYSPKYVVEGVPFISGGNVRPHGVDFENTKFITPELHVELSKRCKPELGDILYTKGGTTGIARVNTYDREFNVWVHVAVLKLTKLIEPFYVQHALNSPFCYLQSQKYTHGVGNQDLGLTRMIKIVLALPPLAEQPRIVAEVERRLSVITTLEQTLTANLSRAERLRQAILHHAFTGQLV